MYLYFFLSDKITQILLLIISFSFLKFSGRKISIFFPAFILLMIIKDFLLLFINSFFIVMLSDYAAISIYMLLYIDLKKIKPRFVIISAVNILSITALSVLYHLNLFTPDVKYFNIILLTDAVILFSELSVIKNHYSALEKTLHAGKYYIAAFFAVYFIMKIILNNPFLLKLTGQSVYLIHGLFLFQYLTAQLTEHNKTALIFNAQKKSVYKLFQNAIASYNYPFKADTAADLITKLFTENSGGSSSAIFITDENDRSLNLASASGKFVFNKKSNIMQNDNILISAAKNGKICMIKNYEKYNTKEMNFFLNYDFISSLILSPVIITNRLYGYIVRLYNDSNRHFNNDDLIYTQLITEYFTEIIRNLLRLDEIIENKEIDKELHIAALIRQKLSVFKIPAPENITVSVLQNPLKNISGDYLNVIKLKNNKTAVIICDVVGKGLEAAIVLLMFASLFLMTSSITDNPSLILSMINKNFASSINIENYATAGLIIIDNLSGKTAYSNAGHLPVMIYKASDRQFDFVDAEGLPVGIDKSSVYQKKEFTLQKNDILILTTDGITEAVNEKNEQFSINRIKDAVRENSAKSAQEITSKINLLFKDFMKNSRQRDDQTLVLIKFN